RNRFAWRQRHDRRAETRDFHPSRLHRARSRVRGGARAAANAKDRPASTSGAGRSLRFVFRRRPPAERGRRLVCPIGTGRRPQSLSGRGLFDERAHMMSELTEIDDANLLAGQAVGYANAFLDGRHDMAKLRVNAVSLTNEVLYRPRHPAANGIL